MHPAYDGLASLPFYDEFDLSTVDVLLISQYVVIPSSWDDAIEGWEWERSRSTGKFSAYTILSKKFIVQLCQKYIIGAFSITLRKCCISQCTTET